MVLLLPVHRPSDQFVSLLDDLMPTIPDPATVVVVDDGSGPAADAVLGEARARGCTVLRLPVNRGKGVALKTGFQHAITTFPGLDVVTADGDGQHRLADIGAVTERAGHGRLVLGVRRIDRMPPRSRLGNYVVARLFQAVTGRSVADTQTGLRAYPAALLERLAATPGERFDYEMNVLLVAVGHGYEFDQVPIATTYLDGNSGSNFRGVADSARVLGTMVRHASRLPVPPRV
jgi:glycosyltransferase involved in cell wall biosynthesis